MINYSNQGEQDMSTRATYEFRTERPSFMEQFEPTFVYKHHDGYPAGAAGHLQCVSELPPHGKKTKTNGGLHHEAAVFVKDNVKRVRDIEFTDSHEIHGDTEYRYIITTYFNYVPANLREIVPVKPRTVEVLERQYGVGRDEWVTILKCSLNDFVKDAGNFKALEIRKQIHQLEQELEEARKS